MNYHKIEKCTMVNGTGLRVDIFVSGCPHHCLNCFNPETHDPESGIPFDNEAYKELMEALDHDYIEGVTFLGGSPLAPYNRETMTELAKDIKERFPEKNIWCYTGYTYEQVKDLEIMKYIDVLVDGRFIEELKDEKAKWRGSTNQRVILIPETRATGMIVLHEDN